MQALILCGGLGTRLKPITEKTPKSMVLVGGKPFLEYQILFLKRYNVKNIILAVGYMSDKIKDYFGDGSDLGVNIIYSNEDSPLGTAGAIKNAERYLEDTFLVVNGDTYLKIDILDFFNFHKKSGSKLTIAIKEVGNSSRYGSVVVNNKWDIIKFKEKEEEKKRGFINAGFYIIEKSVLESIPLRKCSLENEIFPIINPKAFESHQYFIDIGTFKSYETFLKEFEKVI